jgi:hypothetical protein
MNFKNLEDIYQALKDKSLIKFKNFEALASYLIEKPSGKRISEIHDVLVSSVQNYNFNRSDFFEQIILPLLSQKGYPDRYIIEYCFLCLKDEGYLTQFPSVHKFYNFVSEEIAFEKFNVFLLKAEYASNQNRNQIRSVFKNYGAYLNYAFESLSTSNVIESVDFLLKESTYIIWTIKLEEQLRLFMDSFLSFLSHDCKADTKNEDILYDLKKKVAKIQSDLKNLPRLEECSQIIDEKIVIIMRAKEEAKLLSAIAKIESVVSKLPRALHGRDLTETLINKESVRDYADYVSVGNMNYKSTEVPILINFFDKGGVYFDSQREMDRPLILIQNILFRIIFSLPQGHVQLKIIDEYYGRSFQNLLSLPKEIIGNQVYYDDTMILKLFEEVKKRDSNIVFNNLRSSYKNLIEYNKVNEGDFIPLQLFVINNFPVNFSDAFVSYIYNSVSKGSITGSYYIFTLSNDVIFSGRSAEIFNNLLSILPSIKLDLNLIDYLGKSDSMKGLDYKLNDEILISDNLLTQYFGQGAKHNAVNKKDSDISLSGDSTEGIKIKIGTKGIKEDVVLSLGNSTDPVHGIVCGTTGSGKTVLLHQIIIQGSRNYSPFELQFVLLDYKEGTGFKAYKELPNAKIIAIDADIDFGLETLNYLRNEMNARAELFKKHDARDISHFRKKTGKVCPRILIIIDEFQVLLNGSQTDPYTNREIQQIMEEIVRLGRSFGLHLLLATQTPSGVRWTSGTIENIALRIGLRMSPDAENYLFRHTKHIASQFVEPFGKAVYNASSGVEDASVILNVANVDEDKIPLYVQEAVIDAKKNGTILKEEERTVYEGGKYYDVKLPALNEIIWSTANHNLSLSVGIEAKIQPSTLDIVKDEESIPPLIIVGTNPSAKHDLLELILFEFISKSDSDSEIFVFSGNKQIEKEFNSKLNHHNRIIITADKKILFEKIAAISDKIKHDNLPQKSSRMLFVIDGMRSLGNIKDANVSDEKDDWSYGSNSDSSVFKSIDNVILRGKMNSISFVCFSEDKFEIKDILGVNISDFDLGISLGNYNNRIKNELNDSLELKENQAMAYNKIDNSETKFNLIKILN